MSGPSAAPATHPHPAPEDPVKDTARTRTALALAVRANLPVLLWGAPGTGKTASVLALGRELDLPVEVVVGSVREPGDFSGLPVVHEGGTRFAPPRWAERLAAAGEGLLFLDELTTAPPAVQAAMLRVLLERTVGDLVLPAGVRIVAAANPPSSAADGWHLAPPLANRFVHLRWTHDPRTVARGMTGVWPAASMPLVAQARVSTAIAQARGVVSGFLTARPGLAHSLPESAEGRGGAWPSPRTWEMVLRLLATGGAAGASRQALSEAVVGAIGDGAGLELLSYMEQLDLPDPNRVLADPKAFALPERGDRQLAFLTAVVSAVRSEPTRRRWEAGWQVLAKAVEAGVPDVAARAATDLAMMRDPAWPVPEDIDAFVDLLRLSGALPGS